MNNPNSYKSWLFSPLHKAQRQITLHVENLVADLGIGATDGHILAYVERYGPNRVGELVRVFGLKQSTLTSILDRLEARELIVREINPDDRRSFLVSTTPAAADLVERAGERMQEFEQEISSRLTRKDRTALAKLFTAIDDVTDVEIRPAKQNPSKTESTGGP